MINNNLLSDLLVSEINFNAKKATVPKNAQIISVGDKLDFIPFILSGRVRVYIEEHDTLKEVLLYYVENGETCLMSIISSFGNKISRVSAITETDCEVLMVPNEKIRAWQIKYPEWNNLILNLFVTRYDDLIQTIAEMSFKNIEERLKAYLKKHNQDDKKSIGKTHLQISKDLGTSREVITRTLKKLEFNNSF